jgi:hypothetical protein
MMDYEVEQWRAYEAEFDAWRAALAAVPQAAEPRSDEVEFTGTDTDRKTDFGALLKEVQRDAEPVAWPTERITEYIEEYELCADEGYYSPSEHERLLIADAIHGLLADDEFIAALRPCIVLSAAKEGQGK